MVKSVSIRDFAPLTSGLEELLGFQAGVLADTAKVTHRVKDSVEVQAHIYNELLGYTKAIFLLQQVEDFVKGLEKRGALQGKPATIREFYEKLNGLGGIYALAGTTLAKVFEGANHEVKTMLVDQDTETAERVAPAALRLKFSKIAADAKSGYVRLKMVELAGDMDYASVLAALKQ